MDQHRFDQLLQEGLVKQSLPAYLETVIGPLLHQIGESTRLGKLRMPTNIWRLPTFELLSVRFDSVRPIPVTAKDCDYDTDRTVTRTRCLDGAALVSVDGWLPVYLGEHTGE